MKNSDKNVLEIAISQINASCSEKINAVTLTECIKRKTCHKKWNPHIYAFLEEISVPLIHNIVISGFFTFEELSAALDIWGCSDGNTASWIKEMARLGMERTA